MVCEGELRVGARVVCGLRPSGMVLLAYGDWLSGVSSQQEGLSSVCECADWGGEGSGRMYMILVQNATRTLTNPCS